MVTFVDRGLLIQGDHCTTLVVVMFVLIGFMTEASWPRPVPVRLTSNIHYMNVRGVENSASEQLSVHRFCVKICSRSGTNLTTSK